MAWFKHQQHLHEARQLAPGSSLVDGETIDVKLEPVGPQAWLLRQGRQQKPIHVHQSGNHYQVWYGGEYYELQRQSRASDADEAEATDRIAAPLTGKVILVPVQPGQRVAKGETLALLESMKMETAVAAPADAVVKTVHVAASDQVSVGQLLVELDFAAEGEAA